MFWKIEKAPPPFTYQLKVFIFSIKGGENVLGGGGVSVSFEVWTDLFLFSVYLTFAWAVPSGKGCSISGQVVDKILGSRLGSGRVGVSKYTIGYFRVFWVFQGILGIFGYVWVYPYILRFLSNIY